jgi:lysophospholipase L1-like esterase
MRRKILLSLLTIAISASPGPKTHTWVAIGDSITYLNDHRNETGNRVSRGYIDRVVEKLHEIHCINQGHNGWTACQIAASIEQLDIPAADIYTIFLGTNDWWAGRHAGNLADYQNNSGDSTVSGAFSHIIHKIRSLNRKARIILLTPMQRADFVYIFDAKNNAYGSYRKKNGQSLEQIVSAIVAIAELEHLELVDLYHNSSLSIQQLVKYKRVKDPVTGAYKDYPFPDYVDIPFDPVNDEYPYPITAIDKTYDGLHPSDQGNEIIAELLLKLMKY